MFLVDKGDWTTAARVAGATDRVVVLVQPAGDVGGNAGVVGAVRAAEEVENVGAHTGLAY